jgi:hypothetical protein
VTNGSSPDRRVDEAVLRHLSEVFGRLDPVAGTSLFPANRQESLVIEFETDYYPDTIETVRLEIRVYTDGTFHITYLETYLGARRYCRWDRHEQDHNSRDHFHPLPDASTTCAVDRTYPVDVTAVLRETVLPWVNDRLGDLWDTDSS